MFFIYQNVSIIVMNMAFFTLFFTLFIKHLLSLSFLSSSYLTNKITLVPSIPSAHFISDQEENQNAVY